MADSDGTLEERISALEKLFKLHLGPNLAASSMNIPHMDTATGTDLTALTVRVAALETALSGAGRYL